MAEFIITKKPTKIVQKTDTKSVQSKTDEKVQSKDTPKKECAGWCGEVHPISEMREYRKKLYCSNCYALKMDEVEKAKQKPAGLTEDAVKILLEKELERFKIAASSVEMPNVTPIYERLEALEKVNLNLQLRDLVVAAKTIMGHFVVLDRFSKGNQNKRQGDDMRAWLAKAEKILEGK